MTELTLEEFRHLRERLDASPGHQTDAIVSALYRHRHTLLSMTQELIRIRSALDFMEANGIEMFVSGVQETLAHAKDYGWRDPLSPPATPVAELKGGEG